jgi:hypothetical protein
VTSGPRIEDLDKDDEETGEEPETSGPGAPLSAKIGRVLHVAIGRVRPSTAHVGTPLIYEGRIRHALRRSPRAARRASLRVGQPGFLEILVETSGEGGVTVLLRVTALVMAAEDADDRAFADYPVVPMREEQSR